MESKKIIALLILLGEDSDVDSIEIQDENTIDVDGSEYKVLTDEEADEEFKEYEENLLDELGLDSFSDWGRDYVISNCVDVDWFDSAMREMNESYVEDIKHERGRLREEMADAEVETEEEYVDYLCEQVEDSVEWYKDNFGTEALTQVIKDNNLLDVDAVVEWVKDTDGRGCLASYDGEEQESNGFYIYQIS